MSTKATFVTMLLLLCCLALPAAAAPVIQNGSFETPGLPTDSYCYFPSGPVTCSSAFANWTGVYQEGNGNNGFGATHYDGVQALILQDGSYASQTFTSGGGAFILTWFDLQRTNYGIQSQYEPVLDGLGLGVIAPNQSWTERSLQTVVSAGTHTLTFRGIQTGGDSTVFIDSVSADAPQVPEPSTLLLTASAVGSLAFFLRRRRRV